MKKNNKKGFILAETIAISVIIMTSLVIVYTQFMSISNNYYRTFTYNNVNDLYLVDDLRSFILKDGIDKLKEGLSSSNYIDITSCPSNIFTEYIYCRTLIDNLNIKQVIFAKENVSSLKNDSSLNASEKTKEFISYINDKGTSYRLIVEFNTDTYATLLIEGNNGDIAGGEDGDVVLVGDPIIEKAKELVYENGACKTDGTTYSYMGGCYIKGNPNNNYIWYSGFLWRIMGINADGTVRLITDENVTAISWGADNTAENWDESYAKDWLNNYFYSRLKGNNIIKEEIWCSETANDDSSVRTTCSNNLSTETAKVGLITLDEYNLAGGSSSYLNIKQNQWTMTPYSSSNAWGVYFNGDVGNDSVSYTHGVRAVINVNSDVTITSGNGTLGETWSSEAGPYILNEDKNLEVTGKLNEKSTSGEYVLFAGRKYRIVDKDSNGNTKLILDGYYEEDGNIFKMKYNDTSTNVFSKDTGIGQKLNGDVLNWLTNNSETEKAKLVSNYTWYQNNFDWGYDYKVSLNEENPTRSIQATVGLIRVGEMLSSQSSSILTNGYQDTSSYNSATSYWTMTPIRSSVAWSVYSLGDADDVTVSSPDGLRAVIVVTADVTITSGNGTWSNPYQI